MSRTMTLRSACRGDCDHDDSTDGKAGNKKKQHHHHKHHSHNHTQVVESGDTGLKSGDYPTGLLSESISHSSSNGTSHSTKTVTGWRQYTETRTVKSIGVNTHLVKTSNPSIEEPEFLIPSTSFSAGIAKKRVIANNSVLTSSWTNTKNKYSDYSSGDESELDVVLKTDYTYAKSASYRSSRSSPDMVLPPNMSRPGLRSVASIGVDTYNNNNSFTSSKTSNHISQTRSIASTSTSKLGNYCPPHMSVVDGNGNSTSLYSRKSHTQYGNDINRTLTYGLDSDSEIDEFDDRPIRTEKSTVVKESFLHVWFNLVDCVLPIATAWQKFWSCVYWIICSVLLMDSWILSWGSRKIGKKWLLLPLILLLLLLLLDAGNTGFEGAKDAVIATKESILEAIYSFSRVGRSWTDYSYLTAISVLAILKTSKNNESVVSGKYFVPQVSKTVNPVQASTTTSHLNQEQIEKIVRSILNEELSQISLRLKQEDSNKIEKLVRSVVGEELDQITLNVKQSDSVNSEKNIRSIISQELLQITLRMNQDDSTDQQRDNRMENHDQHLLNLEEQIKGILNQQEIVIEEFQRTKKDLVNSKQAENTAGNHRLRQLELELQKMREDIVLLQSGLDVTNKNCCRNNTYDPLLVENQVAALLMQLMHQSPDAGKTRSEFLGFKEWLKAYLNSAAAQMSGEMNAETMQRAEAVARLAAAAAVRDTLKQQEDRLGAAFVSEGKLSEVEVRTIVRDALAKYDADKTGQADYALESAGGTVLSTRCSETYQLGSAQVSWFGIPMWTQTNSPRIVIQPGVQPGNCWAFKGSEGYLVIQLMGLVQPSAFSIEHIPQSLAPYGNIDSAPKDFSIYGLEHEKDLDGTLIGRYSYNADGEPLQFFHVSDPEVKAFKILELKIHSNHGNLEYTCLYRFRVHGKLVKW